MQLKDPLNASLPSGTPLQKNALFRKKTKVQEKNFYILNVAIKGSFNCISLCGFCLNIFVAQNWQIIVAGQSRCVAPTRKN
jgi:2-iminoacetate synthase ThiH